MSQSTSPTESPYPILALVDTNVVLDWLLDRKPWSDEAKPLWDARDAGQLIACLSTSVVTDIFYIVRKQAGTLAAFAAIDRVFVSFGLLAVDAPLLAQARLLPGSDFEDNVASACATNARLNLIVTRNLAGFRHAPMPVIAPPDIAAQLPRA